RDPPETRRAAHPTRRRRSCGLRRNGMRAFLEPHGALGLRAEPPRQSGRTRSTVPCRWPLLALCLAQADEPRGVIRGLLDRFADLLRELHEGFAEQSDSVVELFLIEAAGAARQYEVACAQ